MYEITYEQFQLVKESLSKDTSYQVSVFNSLSLSPYDFSESDIDDYIFIINASSVDDYLEDMFYSPEDYDLFSIDRIRELQEGEQITDVERKTIIEKVLEFDDGLMIFIEPLNYLEDSIFFAAVAQMQGQGGLNFIDCYGFFPDEEDALEAVENDKSIIVV